MEEISLDELAEQLHKALRHEARTGYKDDAVFGGLGAYVQERAENAAERVEDGDLTQRLEGIALSFGHYADNDRNQREVLCTEAAEVVESLREYGDDSAAAKEKSDPPRPATQTEESPDEPICWHDSVTALKGVGEVRSEALGEAGIETVGDLLRYYPHRYRDYRDISSASDLKDDQTACLTVTVTATGTNFFRGRLKITRVPAEDEDTELTLVWFNQPYRVDQFDPGEDLFVVGKARVEKKGLSFVVQECERIHDEGGADLMGQLVPVYSDIDGVSEGQLRKLIAQALKRCTDLPDAVVPPELQARHDVTDLGDALSKMHFPQTHADRKEAQRRLNYQELLVMQVNLALQREQIRQAPSTEIIQVPDALAEDFRIQLPFQLTEAQQRVMEHISGDLQSSPPAHRLIHGDVGSGKTVLAAWALLCAIEAGRQAAMMAPTELLAYQHARNLRTLLQPFDIEPQILTGSLSAADKSDIRQWLETGELRCVVGTHALFQQSVEFDDLAVAIIDEQHRFGVRQRARLADKGPRPNVFVMSATPIPRTLALTLYGDFDISVLDELPPGRQPVDTRVLSDEQRDQAYRLLVDTVKQGHQAYVVCPLVEESSDLSAESATEMAGRLREALEDYADNSAPRLGLVHGQVSADKREQTMRAFREGDIDILVSTTVIEVGVDVPNATAMVVFNAERFGLAQLHQLRGRIARSRAEARCVLVTPSDSSEVIDRLSVLEETADGFEIAEEDLQRRGPGELSGTRQHGMPGMHMSALIADTPALAAAREDARELLEDDPQLERPKHDALREAVKTPDQSDTELTI